MYLMTLAFHLSEDFSTFFEDAVRSLNIKSDEYYLRHTEIISDTAEIVSKKFEKHPKVLAIKQNISVNQSFSNTGAVTYLKKL